MAVVSGCPSSSSPDTSDAAADGGFTTTDGAAICGEFTHSGDPCGPVSTVVCFRQCKTDGCMCKAGGDGTGHWVCTTDFSCSPDGSPLDDGGEADDATTPDDGGSDAADSGSDAAIDANGDGGDDGGLDGSDDGPADAPSDVDDGGG